MKGKVSEIFDSIQGEGIYFGEKQIFMRFFGCNLNCGFCDTRLERFSEYEPEELGEKLRSYGSGYHSVVFTGGEPLLQKDFLREALKITHRLGHRNYLETNGTLPGALEEVIDDLEIVAMDLKLPSSTGLERYWEEHRRFLRIASRKEVFLKAVVCRDTDEKDLQEGLGLIKEIDRSAVLVLQPDSCADQGFLSQKLEHFRDICMREDIACCVIPQMHKILGVR